MSETRKIKPKKLGHLVLAVRDIHKSVAFYTEVLGLEEIGRASCRERV